MDNVKQQDTRTSTTRSESPDSMFSYLATFIKGFWNWSGKYLTYTSLLGAAIIFACSFLYWWFRQEGFLLIRTIEQTWHLDVPALLLSLSGALGFLFLVLYLWTRKKVRELDAIEDTLRESRRKLSERNHELRSSIEFLTAAREIALILNENVDFEKILSKVLRITSQLIGEDRAREISIFMPVEEDGELEVRACWKDGTLEFGDSVSSLNDVQDYVQKAYVHGQELTLAEDDSFHFLLPLIADREITGVIRIIVDMEGNRDFMKQMYSRMSSNLREFTKILALAIKTPDLYTRTIKDGLTGLYSKQHLLNQMETHLSMSNRHREALSLIFVDLDHFKEINDTHGHQTGDRVLRRLGEFLRDDTREYTTAYRYGGEEMVLLSPRTDSEKAQKLAERLRKGIEEMTITSTDGEELDVTASFGVATKVPGEKISGEELLEKADEALYQSKQEGRNRVTIAE